MAAIDGSASFAPARPATSSGTGDLFILLLIIVMPLLATPPMAAHIVEIPGFKVPNIVAILAFLAFLSGANAWRVTDRLQRGALIAFAGYLLVLTLAFLRSLPNTARFHALMPESFQTGMLEYSQSYFVAPVLFAASFVYVLQRMCSRAGLLQTISAISLAMFVLSSAVIAIMLAHPSAILDTDPMRGAINQLTETYLGLHYNGAGTVYVIAGPLLLYMAVTRGSLWTANFVLALVAVLLLKSRTAIFAFAGMSAVTLIVLGRTRTLFALAPVVVAGALALLGRILVHLLSMGFSGSEISTFALLSGREQAIWLPLLAEWIGDPHRFWLGAGLFGVMTSDVLYSARSIFAAGEAHNFYLEFFLDNGIVGFLLFAGGLTAWLVWSWRLGKQIHTRIYWVFYLCVISFLIAGMTGRRYFPESENMLMFPILAAMINVARLKLREGATRGNPRNSGRDSH